MKLGSWFKSRPGLNTAIGVTLAVLAGLLLLGYLTSMLKTGEGGPMTHVPVAGRDIEAGTIVTEKLISSRQIPSDYTVPGALLESGDIRGNQAVRFIGKGEPFTASSLASGKNGSLASRVPEGFRAYSIDLGPVSGAGHELRPGDRVDILSTAGDPPRTRTLLNEKPVLNVSGKEYPGSEEGLEGLVQLTLLVSPEEAMMLAQAEFEGEISFSLCPVATDVNSRTD